MLDTFRASLWSCCPVIMFYKKLDRNLFQSKLSQTWGYLDKKWRAARQIARQKWEACHQCRGTAHLHHRQTEMASAVGLPTAHISLPWFHLRQHRQESWLCTWSGHSALFEYSAVHWPAFYNELKAHLSRTLGDWGLEGYSRSWTDRSWCPHHLWLNQFNHCVTRALQK